MAISYLRYDVLNNVTSFHSAPPGPQVRCRKRCWHSGKESYAHDRWKSIMNLASAIPCRLKTGLKSPFRSFIRHSTFQIRHSSAPLSPQPPSHPVSAPRPGPTRLGPLKSNFLAVAVLKYEGYVQRQEVMLEKTARMDEKTVPANFDYSKIQGIKKEAHQRLTQIRPSTLGQATRIQGVTPPISPCWQ